MTPPLAEISIVPLAKAILCPECSAISNSVHQCPSCGNELGLQALAPVLDRETEDKGARR
jgi:hypothetical protein